MVTVVTVIATVIPTYWEILCVSHKCQLLQCISFNSHYISTRQLSFWVLTWFTTVSKEEVMGGCPVGTAARWTVVGVPKALLSLYTPSFPRGVGIYSCTWWKYMASYDTIQSSWKWKMLLSLCCLEWINTMKHSLSLTPFYSAFYSECPKALWTP
jgi:hypothetical protein